MQTRQKKLYRSINFSFMGTIKQDKLKKYQEKSVSWNFHILDLTAKFFYSHTLAILIYFNHGHGLKQHSHFHFFSLSYSVFFLFHE